MIPITKSTAMVSGSGPTFLRGPKLNGPPFPGLPCENGLFGKLNELMPQTVVATQISRRFVARPYCCGLSS